MDFLDLEKINDTALVWLMAFFVIMISFLGNAQAMNPQVMKSSFLESYSPVTESLHVNPAVLVIWRQDVMINWVPYTIDVTQKF